ncbi:MAG: hypothetical protein ABIO70_19190 [Pseudomonadota bacterium]
MNSTRLPRAWALGALLSACHPAPPDSAPPSPHDSDTGEPSAIQPFDCDTHADPPLTSLPDRVHLRTATTSFNTDWYVALLDGVIWVKPNEETTGEEGDWRLLGAEGLPDGDRLDNWGPPAAIAELSSDGVHLHALSEAGHFYRGSDMTTDIHDYFEWTDAWGGLTGTGDGLSREFSTRCGWDVSDSHPFGVASYEDTNGTSHSVGAGVAHLYRLGEEGRRIFFNDWYLPNDWSRQICGPERGTFQALDISVSASTIFLVGHRGELYTRLYDFDTGGENPLLTYSWIVGPDSGTTRRLPAEGWRRQPDITEGRITPRVTVFQDGQGNAARVLRVQGVRDGEGGYFEKHVYDEEWRFVATGEESSGPFLDEAAAPDPVAPADFALRGTLSYESHTLEIELLDFNMLCSPARARLLWEATPVTSGGDELLLDLHHVQTWVEGTRPVEFWEQGIPAEVMAALIVPDDLARIDDAEARAAVQAILRDKAVVDFLGQASPDGLSLSEIMWTEPFRVPAEEKEFWSPIALELSPAD